MKKLFFLFVLLFSLKSFSQTNTSVSTYNVATSDMVWSDMDEKYLFFPVDERHFAKFVWNFTFNDNYTGAIKSSHIGRTENTNYGFNIYKWEIRNNNDGSEYIWVDAIQVSDSQKVTFIINKNSYGENMISLFMPEKNKFLTFDNFNE